MKMRQKFFALAAIAVIILGVVSAIGYYNAQKYLTESIEKQLGALVQKKADDLDQWINGKGQNIEFIASSFQSMDVGKKAPITQAMLGGAKVDKDIIDFVYADAQGIAVSYAKGNTGMNVAQLDWYQGAKATSGLFYGRNYTTTQGESAIPIAMSVKSKDGQVNGVLAFLIALESLNKQAETLKYEGHGAGFIMSAEGICIGHTNKDYLGEKITDNPSFASHAQEILASDAAGFFIYEVNGEKRIFAYRAVPSTHWVVGFAVSANQIYGSLTEMKIVYGGLTGIGLLVLVFICLQFAKKITRPMIQLTEHAQQMANGNLHIEKMMVESKDEIGDLTHAFNSMRDNLQQLISKMAISAEQVAASSEELTAGAAQSAEASNHIAETVMHIADGMHKQMESVGTTTNHVNHIIREIMTTSDSTQEVASIATTTSNAAEKGKEMMDQAIGQMNHIKKSVEESANVVVQLNESSQKIGRIIEVISSMAEQTNLLALNAAIEAARAGEHGRGFAVVAEEVRKLAEQSQGSAEEIKMLILKIRQETDRAVYVMNAGTQEVKNGSDVIENVGSEFNHIIDMVQNISQKMQEISASVQQVSAGGQEILQAVQQVNDVSRESAGQTESISAATQEQSASSQEIASSSHSLAQMAMDMQGIIRKFKI